MGKVDVDNWLKQLTEIQRDVLNKSAYYNFSGLQEKSRSRGHDVFCYEASGRSSVYRACGDDLRRILLSSLPDDQHDLAKAALEQRLKVYLIKF